MSVEAGQVIPLGFTKLVVENLDVVSQFYQSVCGLVEEGRAEEKLGGRPICESYFRADPPGTGTFILTKFLDAPRPICEALILGFVTDDVVKFVERAVIAGGALIEAPRSDPEHGVKVAFVKDVEGNLIEVVELL